MQLLWERVGFAKWSAWSLIWGSHQSSLASYWNQPGWFQCCWCSRTITKSSCSPAFSRIQTSSHLATYIQQLVTWESWLKEWKSALSTSWCYQSWACFPCLSSWTSTLPLYRDCSSALSASHISYCCSICLHCPSTHSHLFPLSCTVWRIEDFAFWSALREVEIWSLSWTTFRTFSLFLLYRQSTPFPSCRWYICLQICISTS